MKFSNRILSGVQPSGDLHLGNYLGAIKNFVSLQHKYECYFCVVDLHAITVWQDPQQLAHKTREVIASFIASGIDPENNILFNDIFKTKFQSSLKKISVNQIPGIEEVNMIKDDGSVMHFNNPKV